MAIFVFVGILWTTTTFFHVVQTHRPPSQWEARMKVRFRITGTPSTPSQQNQTDGRSAFRMSFWPTSWQRWSCLLARSHWSFLAPPWSGFVRNQAYQTLMFRSIFRWRSGSALCRCDIIMQAIPPTRAGVRYWHPRCQNPRPSNCSTPCYSSQHSKPASPSSTPPPPLSIPTCYAAALQQP
ncbi:hypothetical protein L210DRAFT_536920 [Boletus edulis BED1]|uniref:Secreted protein n=1 Tax=Boletus edulis BED1 TaxID=1328754 RepID=A0AAD4BK13_BOLED|nr:hypothetical protein L210DRAFT_536920 [Boletus edulis BED1]